MTSRDQVLNSISAFIAGGGLESFIHSEDTGDHQPGELLCLFTLAILRQIAQTYDCTTQRVAALEFKQGCMPCAPAHGIAATPLHAVLQVKADVCAYLSCCPQCCAEPPIARAVKPQTWLGIQQQQKPRRARKAQQPLAERLLPRDARLAQQAQRAPHHSDDTVEDNRRAELAQQRLPGHFQPRSTAAAQADVQISHPDKPSKEVLAQDPRVQPEASMGIQATEVETAAAKRAKHSTREVDVVPCTPVAAAAHVAQPTSLRTRARTAQASQAAAAPRQADARKEAGADVAGAKSAPAPRAQDVQPGQPSTAQGEAPQQELSCGFDELEFEAALLQTDEQAPAAAKQRRVTMSPAGKGAAKVPLRRNADAPAAQADAHKLYSAAETAAAAATAAAATVVQLMLPAPANSLEFEMPATTPHKALHWRGSRAPAAQPQQAPAMPADSGCPSGLGLDPATAFHGLGGLVQAVQGDQAVQANQGAHIRPEQQADEAPAGSAAAAAAEELGVEDMSVDTDIEGQPAEDSTPAAPEEKRAGRMRRRAAAEVAPESMRRSGRARKAPKRSLTASPQQTVNISKTAAKPSSANPETPAQPTAERSAQEPQQNRDAPKGMHMGQTEQPSSQRRGAAARTRGAAKRAAPDAAAPEELSPPTQPAPVAEAAAAAEPGQPSGTAIIMTQSVRKLKRKLEGRESRAAEESPAEHQQSPPTVMTQPSSRKMERVFCRRKSMPTAVVPARKDTVPQNSDAAKGADFDGPTVGPSQQSKRAAAEEPSPVFESAPAHGSRAKPADKEKPPKSEQKPPQAPAQRPRTWRTEQSAPVPALEQIPARGRSARRTEAEIPMQAAPKAALVSAPVKRSTRSASQDVSAPAPAAAAASESARRATRAATRSPSVPARAPAAAPEPARRATRVATRSPSVSAPAQAPAKRTRHAAKGGSAGSAPAPAPAPVRRTRRAASKVPSAPASEATPAAAADVSSAKPAPVPALAPLPARRTRRTAGSVNSALKAEAAPTAVVDVISSEPAPARMPAPAAAPARRTRSTIRSINPAEAAPGAAAEVSSAVPAPAPMPALASVPARLTRRSVASVSTAGAAPAAAGAAEMSPALPAPAHMQAPAPAPAKRTRRTAGSNESVPAADRRSGRATGQKMPTASQSRIAVDAPAKTAQGRVQKVSSKAGAKQDKMPPGMVGCSKCRYKGCSVCRAKAAKAAKNKARDSVPAEAAAPVLIPAAESQTEAVLGVTTDADMSAEKEPHVFMQVSNPLTHIAKHRTVSHSAAL